MLVIAAGIAVVGSAPAAALFFRALWYVSIVGGRGDTGGIEGEGRREISGVEEWAAHLRRELWG